MLVGLGPSRERRINQGFEFVGLLTFIPMIPSCTLVGCGDFSGDDSLEDEDDEDRSMNSPLLMLMSLELSLLALSLDCRFLLGTLLITDGLDRPVIFGEASDCFERGFCTSSLSSPSLIVITCGAGSADFLGNDLVMVCFRLIFIGSSSSSSLSSLVMFSGLDKGAPGLLKKAVIFSCFAISILSVSYLLLSIVCPLPRGIASIYVASI